jgi:glutamate-ammonia-ligase adenylyltransferase
VEQMRQKQLKAMLNPSQVNAKYSKGALVDIEYNVQYLQCYYFKEYDYIDSPHTLIALGQLLEHKIISASSYEKLSNAYAFFRRLINSLRMVRGHAKDLLIPKASSNEYLYLCKRLHYQDTKEGTAQTQLQDEIIKHP